ncbi:MAG TPA: hypothetical protein P5279_00490 [Anaerohalosphaeraceae bacterium]|nr:hypothetical protein [Anaerohalosphaeraceae bacterium]HRT85066.1 hypothetical protein [Anaerohalosphaeraceae bacterium]
MKKMLRLGSFFQIAFVGPREDLRGRVHEFLKSVQQIARAGNRSIRLLRRRCIWLTSGLLEKEAVCEGVAGGGALLLTCHDLSSLLNSNHKFSI